MLILFLVLMTFFVFKFFTEDWSRHKEGRMTKVFLSLLSIYQHSKQWIKVFYRYLLSEAISNFKEEGWYWFDVN